MKKTISLILGTVLLFVLAGCKDPKQANKSSKTETTEVKTLKIQMTFPKTSYDAQIVGMWAEKVTGLTGGSLQFELLGAGSCRC